MITPHPLKQARQIKLTASWGRLARSAALAAVVGWLSRFGLSRPALVALAVLIIVIVELLPYRRQLRTGWLAALPPVITGASVAVIVALSPRALTQIIVILAYAWWHSRRQRQRGQTAGLGELLMLLAVMFEAVFLAAEIWRVSTWVCLVVVWLASYGLVYTDLTRRGDRLARVLAATWALIVVEVGWVFLNWLVTYVLVGSYILIPQAALILTGLGYCFGGIYISQRQQALTRGRLAEYLFIALLLVVIVVSSTPWRGSL